jgi:hypothetical protein
MTPLHHCPHGWAQPKMCPECRKHRPRQPMTASEYGRRAWPDSQWPKVFARAKRLALIDVAVRHVLPTAFEQIGTLHCYRGQSNCRTCLGRVEVIRTEFRRLMNGG